MSLLPHFGYKKLHRQPVSGRPLLVGYDRLTRTQRAAWNGLKILAQAFALFLLAITLLWLWPLLWGAP